MRRRTAVTGGLALLVAALVAVGLAQAPRSDAPPDAAASEAAAPAGPVRTAALADLRRRAGELRAAEPADLRAQLRRLRGTPVVVNVWGSWCDPCRAEFPILRRVASETNDRVGWLGIDVLDRRAPAERFLAGQRTTWPHLFDPTQALLRELGTGTGNVPMTVFVDRAGRVGSVKYGEYRSAVELRTDLRRRLGVGGAP